MSYEINCIIVIIYLKPSFHSEAVHTYSRKLQLPELSPQGKSNEYFFFFMSLINDPYQMKKSN